MSKTTELELTFLAREIPAGVKAAEPKPLVDTYIPEDSDFPILRLRRIGDNYEITKKIPVNPGDYSVHTEHTIPLTEEEYSALKGASKRVVEKNRYRVNIDNNEAEVDVFSGALAGLVLIDFEFASETEKAAFQPPPCCLVDVTQERFILGGQLAGSSYADIEEELRRFNYRKLLIDENTGH